MVTIPQWGGQLAYKCLNADTRTDRYLSNIVTNNEHADITLDKLEVFSHVNLQQFHGSRSLEVRGAQLFRQPRWR